MAFAHLHTHTEYSLLDGSNKIKDYVKRVKELGMTSAAITDHGVMYGVIDFYKTCKAEGIHPVLGCEVYVAPESRFDREPGNNDDRYYHLILLAENNTGYQNLMKIVSIGFTDGFYYKPRVDREILEKYHEGIICLSACLAGEVAKLLERGFYNEAKEAALWHRDTFGEGNYFLELQDHGIPAQQTVNQGLIRISQETGIELVATNDCHYTYVDDTEAHEILLCVQTGKKITDEDRLTYAPRQFYVRSEDEMRSIFPYALQALENTQLIADRCNVEIEFGVTKLPRYDVPEGYDAWTYLNKLCFDGLEERYGNNPDYGKDRLPELKKQLEYELSVIQKMGYVDYFLIVWDFINYARTHGIPVGPGRGSAAGSLVSYTTGITNIDPIRYNLLFERFLNPDRVSMPDIDVDFCYERRSEVIDYVVEKYGGDCVTQIVTFGTMAARNAIRDVGRVLDLPYTFVDQIAKSIPKELNITIEKALKMNPELRAQYESDAEVKRLIDFAMKLEGLPRNTGTHAAGVVIASKPMDEFVPLARSSEGGLVTQFTMTTIEELGLLKMDFLGLRTLTVINDAVKLIEEQHGIKINVDEIDYADMAVLESIGTGHTEGIFQLESAGMKSFMKELQPQSLEDVIAGISLYRPGPMDFIPEYISGKKNQDDVTYACPELKPILEPTYGCIVYQEQVMQIVQNLAGFSMGRADNVRRAMSKKKDKVMQAERQVFVYGSEEDNVPGCVKNGIDEAVANGIYDKMIDFAKYAFNKSHAAAYAVVSYQTAYLKKYYPVEFMAALMTSVIDHSGKVAEYIQVCRNMNIEVLPPDINTGAGAFAVKDGKIRYGMYSIKSVGRPVIDSIVEEREANGPYLTLEDFLNRVNGKMVNSRAIENLIKAGALDGLDGNRRQMMMIFPAIMDQATKNRKNNMSGQMSLFDMLGAKEKEAYSVKMPDVDEFPKDICLANEKEVLGIYVSGHPLEDYVDIMQKNVNATSSEFILDDETGDVLVEDSSHVVVGGMITAVTNKFTKNNQQMAFITLEDLVGQIEVIVFPRDFELYRSEIHEDNKVFIKGKVNAEDDKDAKLICEGIVPFDSVPKEIWIQFENKEEYQKKEQFLFSMLANSEGPDTIAIYISDIKAVKKLPANQRISGTEAFVERLGIEFGTENVKVVEKSVEFERKRY